MHHAFSDSAHHMRLGCAKRRQCVFPVSRRDGVFHLPQRGADTPHPAAIDLGAPFYLPNALLCRLMMSHLSTQLNVPCTILEMSAHSYSKAFGRVNRRYCATRPKSSATGELPVLERGFALVCERRHAFLLILGRENGVEHAPLEMQSLRQRRLERPVDRFLRDHCEGA